MGARGPKRTCECGACQKCRRREINNRSRKKRGYVDPNVTERVRAWRVANREHDNARQLAYYHRNKGPQTRARHAVAEAIKRNNLVRQPCEVCGAEKVDAHHDDYDRPLEVRWLCRVHHMRHHKEMV